MPDKVSISRRQFLGYGMCGLAGIAVGSWGVNSFPGTSFAQSFTAPLGISLSFEEGLVEMVDKEPVYHWLFKLSQFDLPVFPGPVIFATEGEQIDITLSNNLDEEHAFEVLRVAGSFSGPIAPGSSRTVSFVAPAPGTYLYLDPLNAPVNRVMGLHGAFIVLPRGVQENSAVNTPYSRPTVNVQRLFNDLGSSAHFPGDPWIPLRPFSLPANDHLPAEIERFLFRTRIWLFTQVDPHLNERVRALGAGAVFNAVQFQHDFLPRYFLINGRSGAFASHDQASALEGFIGEPFLVRQLNAGLATPSNHLHSNHYYVLAINNVVQENVIQPDSMSLTPVQTQAGDSFFTGGSTLDWLVPLTRPPDIPGNPDTPLRELIPEELSLVIGNVPQSPLRYPMHDHTEQSQTAAGGNYPQGDVTDLVFLGDVDKVPFPKSTTPVGVSGSGGSGHRH